MIYDNTRGCKCDTIRPEDLKRKGRVFLHIVCGCWYPNDLGAHLKRQTKIKPKSHKLVATARSY